MNYSCPCFRFSSNQKDPKKVLDYFGKREDGQNCAHYKLDLLFIRRLFQLYVNYCNSNIVGKQISAQYYILDVIL